jgi:predicted nucleic acid-binding protein
MNVLVDTSVWSLALRRGRPKNAGPVRELRDMISARRVLMIGPIRQEILSGIGEDAQFKALAAQLAAFPDLPIETEDYIRAARFFNICRQQGIQGSNTDFLVCAVAFRNRSAIFTTDEDFTSFAAHLPITLHQYRQHE